MSTSSTRIDTACVVEKAIAELNGLRVDDACYKRIIQRIEFLHKGKYGRVHLAQTRSDATNIAVKTIPVTRYEAAVEYPFSVWSETRILGVLAQCVKNRIHPGFPLLFGWTQTYTAGESTEKFRLLMEVSCFNACEWFTRMSDRASTAIPTVGIAFSFVAQALTAILAMGAVGISNNDLYDRNILIDTTCERVITVQSKYTTVTFRTHGLLIKIADFGLASSPLTGDVDFTPKHVGKKTQESRDIANLTQSPTFHIVYARNIPPAARDLVTVLWMLNDNAAKWKGPAGAIVARYAKSALIHISGVINTSYREGKVFTFEDRDACIGQLLGGEFMNLWPAGVRVGAKSRLDASVYIIPDRFDYKSIVPDTTDLSSAQSTPLKLEQDIIGGDRRPTPS